MRSMSQTQRAFLMAPCSLDSPTLISKLLKPYWPGYSTICPCMMSESLFPNSRLKTNKAVYVSDDVLLYSFGSSECLIFKDRPDYSKVVSQLDTGAIDVRDRVHFGWTFSLKSHSRHIINLRGMFLFTFANSI